VLTTPVDQRQHLSSTYLKRRANLAESYDSEGCRNEAELDQKAVFTHSTMVGHCFLPRVACVARSASADLLSVERFMGKWDLCDGLW
jgi:hypothetical protein